MSHNTYESLPDDDRQKTKDAAVSALREVIPRALHTQNAREGVDIVLEANPDNPEGLLAESLLNEANAGMMNGLNPEQALWFAAGAVASAKAATHLREQSAK